MLVCGGTFSPRSLKTFADSSLASFSYIWLYTWRLCASSSGRTPCHSAILTSRRDPLFAAITLCGIIAIFKPYPSIADSALYLTLLPLFPQIYQHTRNLFVIAIALLYCCIFGPAFHYLWIYQGSGNANFFYAITLVWNLSQGLLLTDVVFAWLKEEWEILNPEHRGKRREVVQIAD